MNLDDTFDAIKAYLLNIEKSGVASLTVEEIKIESEDNTDNTVRTSIQIEVTMRKPPHPSDPDIPAYLQKQFP